MAVKKDLSSLPQGRADEGRPPDQDPWFVRALAERWADEVIGDDDRPFAVEGTMFRASWAGKCSRQIGYRLLLEQAKRRLRAMDPTDPEFDALENEISFLRPAPRTLASSWSMFLGRTIHEMADKVAKEAWPDAEVEYAVDLRPELDGSATLDFLIHRDHESYIGEGMPPEQSTERVVVELKSINGFGYKLAATRFKGPPQGPKWQAVVQGSLQASGVKADRLIIANVSLEAMSPDLADAVGTGDLGRVMAQWTFLPEEFEAIAEAERTRLSHIGMLVQAGHLPPRQFNDPEVPLNHRVVEVKPKGVWQKVTAEGVLTQTGTFWECLYCDWKDRCDADGM